MAEEEYNEDLKIEEGRQSSQRPKAKAYGGYMNRRCNARLEELAKPRKWLMLATWREHRCAFDPIRMQALKERIQEEFSMTPEETEVYFNQLRRRARKIVNKKALAKQIRKEKALAREEAYRLFKKLLCKAMKYAFLHPPPPIVSPMMRETSNKILELLCDIHSFDIPKRQTSDKKFLFLIFLSDWAAILISNIYYEVDVNEQVEIECPEHSIITITTSTETSIILDEEDEEITQTTGRKSEPERISDDETRNEVPTESFKTDDETAGEEESFDFPE